MHFQAERLFKLKVRNWRGKKSLGYLIVEKITCSNFYTSNHASFGNCFTFNTALNDNDPLGGERVTSLTGPNFGLDLVINIEQSKYMTGGVTPSAGARIVVHGASGRPLPDEMGHQLQPNTITALAIEEACIHNGFQYFRNSPYIAFLLIIG